MIDTTTLGIIKGFMANLKQLKCTIHCMRPRDARQILKHAFTMMHPMEKSVR